MQRDPCFDSLITMESNRYLMYFMRNWRFFFKNIILCFSRVATREKQGVDRGKAREVEIAAVAKCFLY